MRPRVSHLIGPSFWYSCLITSAQAFCLAVLVLPHLNISLKLQTTIMGPVKQRIRPKEEICAKASQIPTSRQPQRSGRNADAPGSFFERPLPFSRLAWFAPFSRPNICSVFHTSSPDRLLLEVFTSLEFCHVLLISDLTGYSVPEC